MVGFTAAVLLAVESDDNRSPRKPEMSVLRPRPEVDAHL